MFIVLFFVGLFEFLCACPCACGVHADANMSESPYAQVRLVWLRVSAVSVGISSGAVSSGRAERWSGGAVAGETRLFGGVVKFKVMTDMNLARRSRLNARIGFGISTIKGIIRCLTLARISLSCCHTQRASLPVGLDHRCTRTRDMTVCECILLLAAIWTLPGVISLFGGAVKSLARMCDRRKVPDV